MQNTAVI